jgi:hypothetical protein
VWQAISPRFDTGLMNINFWHESCNSFLILHTRWPCTEQLDMVTKVTYALVYSMRYFCTFIGFIITCNAGLAVSGRWLFLSFTLLVSISKYCHALQWPLDCCPTEWRLYKLTFYCWNLTRFIDLLHEIVSGFGLFALRRWSIVLRLCCFTGN